jgi:single-strand DNA-binding protein
MAGGVNKVILVGNLGKDPEVRYLESGVAVASFSIATSESFKDRTTGERKTQTEWHNVVLWRGLAEVAEKYLKKGNQIYVEGKLRTRQWQDKEGNTRYTTEIVGDNMTMLGGRPEGGDSGGGFNNQTSAPAQNTPAAEKKPATDDLASSDNDMDDLPF